MPRKTIVAGNWKMNKTYKEGLRLAQSITKKTKSGNADVILAPPFLHLAAVAEVTKSNANVMVAAQNCHEKQSGAFTGAISSNMIKSAGAGYVIIGHSERREIFAEDNKLLTSKVNAALEAKLKVIFCCGEPLPVREKKRQTAYVNKQIRDSLFHLSAKEFSKIVIAYEPIWAIGTGVTASPKQAQEMHKKIRKLITDKYGAKLAEKTNILYGGSVKPANAAELFSQPDVDGGLVGGASLTAKDFMAIIDAA